MGMALEEKAMRHNEGNIQIKGKNVDGRKGSEETLFGCKRDGERSAFRLVRFC